MRYLPMVLLALTLAACAGKTEAPLPGQPPAVQPTAAEQAAKRQAQFDGGCRFASGVWFVVKPMTKNPVIMGKLGSSARLAVTSLGTAVEVTCTKPLDLTSTEDIVQRLYDLAGQVMAEVIAAQN